MDQPCCDPAIKTLVLAKKVVAIEGFLTGKFYPDFSEKDRVIIAEKEAMIARLSAEVDASKEQYAEYNAAIPLTSAAAFEVGNRPGVAHAFLEIRFKVSKREGILRSYFWINGYDGGAVIGCYDLSGKTAVTADCLPHSEDGFEAERLQVAERFMFDESSGRIDFAFDMPAPEAVGFEKKERVAADAPSFESFNDFDAVYYRGKTMRLELYPNRVMEALDVLTGKAFLEEDNQVLYEAAVSLWDQNL